MSSIETDRRAAPRTTKEADATDKRWQEFIARITRRHRGATAEVFPAY